MTAAAVEAEAISPPDAGPHQLTRPTRTNLRPLHLRNLLIGRISSGAGETRRLLASSQTLRGPRRAQDTSGQSCVCEYADKLAPPSPSCNIGLATAAKAGRPSGDRKQKVIMPLASCPRMRQLIVARVKVESDRSRSAAHNMRILWKLLGAEPGVNQAI